MREGVSMNMMWLKRGTLTVLKYLWLLFCAFIVSLPIISMLGTAVKPRELSRLATMLVPPPGDWTFASLYHVIVETTFMRNILNSALVSLTVTIAVVAAASLSGYALSRFRGAYFTGYGMFMFALQMLPGVLQLLPLYILFSQMNLINTLYSVMIAYTAFSLPFSILMLNGFFDTIPRELEQAAMVDGCDPYQAFLRVIIPISLPGVATVSIFTFINSWNEYTNASVFLKKQSVQTMTVGLQQFVQQFRSDWAWLMAAALIAIVPMLIFLVFTQKLLIQGMTVGAVKG